MLLDKTYNGFEIHKVSLNKGHLAQINESTSVSFLHYYLIELALGVYELRDCGFVVGLIPFVPETSTKVTLKYQSVDDNIPADVVKFFIETCILDFTEKYNVLIQPHTRNSVNHDDLYYVGDLICRENILNYNVRNFHCFNCPLDILKTIEETTPSWSKGKIGIASGSTVLFYTHEPNTGGGAPLLIVPRKEYNGQSILPLAVLCAIYSSVEKVRVTFSLSEEEQKIFTDVGLNVERNSN